MSMSHATTLLLVGADDGVAARLASAVTATGRGWQVRRVASAADAPAQGAWCAAVVALDAGFPGPAAVRAVVGEVPLLVLAGIEDEAAVARWLAEGADGWLFLPGLLGVAAVLVRVEQERAHARERALLEARRAAVTTELLRLARSPSFRGSDLAAALREVDEAAVRGIGVSRCGVWLLDEARTTIRQEDVYFADEGRHGAGATLSVSAHRDYFDALHAQRLLPVADVNADPRTRKLVPDYFGPEGIGATIDVAVRLRGELVGALCIEHLGTARTWRPEEEAFAGALADLVSLALEATERHRAEAALAQSELQLERQVAESQKAEALARLASHIAHDVNNLLTVIVAHAQRLEALPGRPAEVAQAILQATLRGRELTQQVLTFGRRRTPERVPLDLAGTVREVLTLLGPTAGEVLLRPSLSPVAPPVLGDAGQLHQVLVNLCTNALQAMQGRRGAVTVSLDAVDVGPAEVAREPRLSLGRWVRLAVRDEGVGMDEATRRRIFEPFFSARDGTTGTGLGLAVVQTIVQAHGGVVLVESTPGRGTLFSVYLRPARAQEERPGEGRHLLLVDDHPGMARVSAKLLETLGYRTTVFDDPRQALATFTEAPERFDAVITDLSMPQMSGEDFTRALRVLRPTVPIIVSSGLAMELDEETRRRLGFDAVLVKPWRLEEAVSALQRVLP